MADSSLPDGGDGAGEVRVAPAFDFVIEEGKAAEFARATHAPVPSGGRPLAPATFLAASALWMTPENSAWYGIDRDYRRVLHGEQRFDYPRGLPVVGTRFRARQSFGRSFEKAGSRGIMQFTEVVTAFWTTDESDPDATMTSLSITLPEADAAAEGAPQAAPRSATAQRAETTGPAASDALLTHVTEPLTITDFVRYQGASGDFNPIHHDTEFARAGGYPSPFAVGMLTAGVAAAQLGRVRDIDRLRSLRTRWKSQAWPGDRLTYAVMAGADAATLDVTVTRADGSVHMTAQGVFS